VQDTLARALVALQDLEFKGPGGGPPPLRPWLFRIAHNRALDLLRSRGGGAWAEPDRGGLGTLPTRQSLDPVEMLMRQESGQDPRCRAFCGAFPTLQRSGRSS